MKNRRYKVGDVVLLRGEYELYEVIDLYVESTSNKYHGDSELCYITLEGMKSGVVMDSISEDDPDISLLAPSMRTFFNDDTAQYNIDLLLDQYNHCSEMHRILNKNGIKDTEYQERATSIMELINHVFGYSRS